MTLKWKSALGVVVLSIAMLIIQVVAGTVAQFIPQPPIRDIGGSSPIGPGLALVIIVSISGALLAALASCARGNFWQRALFLFTILFTVNYALSAVEAAYFLVGWLMRPSHIFGLLANGLVAALLAALCAAALFRPGEAQSRVRIERSTRPAAAVIVLYFAAYSVAGYFIAWQSPAVRAFYEGGIHVAVPELLALEIARGAVWLGILLLCVRVLAGLRFPLALLVGACFAGFMALPLLYPGGLMPWSVRSVHFVEISISNFAFGVLGFLWLTRATQPGREVQGEREGS